jgi:VanZ family protein
MRIKSFLFSYYRSLLVFLLILFASTIRADEVQKLTLFTIPNLDKLIHLGMYFCFAFVLIFDILKAKPDFSNIKIYFISAITALIYGGSLEIVQATLTNSRSGDILDFLFNATGVVLAVVLWMILRKPR